MKTAAPMATRTSTTRMIHQGKGAFCTGEGSAVAGASVAGIGVAVGIGVGAIVGVAVGIAVG